MARSTAAINSFYRTLRTQSTTAGNDIVARPDDPSDRKGLSWRQKVEQYGKTNNGNPYRLAKAYQLYKP